ncbi:hypothetical protein, partial [Salmonella enterica]
MSAPALRDIHTLFYRGYLKSCNYHCGYCPAGCLFASAAACGE